MGTAINLAEKINKKSRALISRKKRENYIKYGVKIKKVEF